MDWLIAQFYSTFIKDNRYLWFAEGLRNTLIIAVGAAALGIIIGSAIAMVRVYHAQTGRLKYIDKFFGGYLALFRGTPIVVQLLIMYYVIFTNFHNALAVAVIAFGINSGAYVAEIVRGGILSIDIGQTEAGRSLGLSAFSTLLLIVMPQALKNTLPSLGNELIALIKDTSVVSFITVRDLARAAENVRSRTAEPLFSLLFIAVVYFLLVLGITKLFGLIERRMHKIER